MRRHLLAALADPRLRLRAGLAGLVLSGIVVDGERVGRHEAALFHAVNDLPDGLFPLAWPVMQSGQLSAVPISATIARAAGRPWLAARLLLAGAASWALAKGIKRVYRRPRPTALLAGTRCRGPEPSGLGYASGHAAVAAALGVATLGELGPRGRAPVLAASALVGLCRIYVGAHLPLDVAGGAAMGVAVEAVVALLLPDRHCTRIPTPRTFDRPTRWWA